MTASALIFNPALSDIELLKAWRRSWFWPGGICGYRENRGPVSLFPLTGWIDELYQ